MATAISLQLEGLDEVRKYFNDMQDRLKRPGDALNRIAAIGYTDVMDHFRKEQGSKGRWQALDASTVAARRKGKKGRTGTRILQDTGFLRESILYRSDDREAVVFTLCDYADYHQHQHADYSRPPQRDFLWMSKDAISRVTRYFARFLVSGED